MTTAPQPELSYERIKLFNFLWVVLICADRDYAWFGWMQPLLPLAAFLFLFIKNQTLLLFSLTGLQIFLYSISSVVIGNHNVIQFFIAVPLLLSSGWDLLKKTDPSRKLFVETFFSLQPIFFIFYFFATFHKLNTGYFDPLNSCVHLVNNKILTLFPGNISSPAALGAFFIWGSLIVEGVFPSLIRNTKFARMSLLVLSVFHVYLSANFFEFLPFILSMFLFFLPEAMILEIYKQFHLLLFAPTKKAFLILLFVFAISFHFSVLSKDTGVPPPYVFGWIGYGLAIIISLPFFRTLATFSGPYKMQPFSFSKISVIPMFLLCIILVLPYSGLRSTSSLTMYSNLRTEGKSNHFFMPSLGLYPEYKQMIILDIKAYRYINKHYLYVKPKDSAVVEINEIQLGRILHGLSDQEKAAMSGLILSPNTSVSDIEDRYLKTPWILKQVIATHPMRVGDFQGCYW